MMHAAWYVPSVHRVCRGLCCKRHRCWIVLPKVAIYKQIAQSCNIKQQSHVANSRQQSRSSTNKVSNEKHNFSHINIFVCDDHANYLQLHIYMQACNDVPTHSFLYHIIHRIILLPSLQHRWEFILKNYIYNSAQVIYHITLIFRTS